MNNSSTKSMCYEIKNQQNAIDISVVVCTFNRARYLLACLEAFEQIETHLNWELVIINNNSTDDTQSIIDTFKAQSVLNIKTEIEHHKGLSHARNKGVSLSTGSYIAFTDDDCYPQSDYIEAIAKSVKDNPDVGFIGGRVLLFDKDDLPITIQLLNEVRHFSKEFFLEPGAIHGANFVFKREALMSAHMFDTRLGAGTRFPSEDVDTLAEVLRLGWPGVYDPSVVVYHHHRRKSESDRTALMINYDWGRGAYYAKRILKSGQRWLYLKTWIKKVRWQPLSVTKRELTAAIHFWMKIS